MTKSMIEDFKYITEKMNVITPNLNADGDPYFESEDVRRHFTNSLTRGFSWRYKGKEVKMIRTGTRFFGHPSPDMRYVIVIYPVDDKKFPAPSNAVIYNPTGSIHRRLKMPGLISYYAKVARSRDRSNENSEKRFDNVFWTRLDNGEIGSAMTIGFDHEWTEERLLDPETGEFGICIDSSKL